MESGQLQDIISFISSVGFPIACCVWFMYKGHDQSKDNTKAINNLANAVDNNTRVVERLIQWDGIDRRSS